MAFSICGPEKIPRKETGQSYTILNELRNFVKPRRLQAVGCGAELSAGEAEPSSNNERIGLAVNLLSAARMLSYVYRGRLRRYTDILKVK